MRPRIQATISNKAYDIVLDKMTDPKSPLFNRCFSRAIDTVILEWSDFQEKLRMYQEKLAESYQQNKSTQEKGVIIDEI